MLTDRIRGAWLVLIGRREAAEFLVGEYRAPPPGPPRLPDPSVSPLDVAARALAEAVAANEQVRGQPFPSSLVDDPRKWATDPVLVDAYAADVGESVRAVAARRRREDETRKAADAALTRYLAVRDGMAP